MITQINGKNIHIYEEFQLYNLTHGKEDTAELTVERDGKEQTIQMEKRLFQDETTKEWDSLIRQMWRSRAFSKASSTVHTRQNTG